MGNDRHKRCTHKSLVSTFNSTTIQIRTKPTIKQRKWAFLTVTITLAGSYCRFYREDACFAALFSRLRVPYLRHIKVNGAEDTIRFNCHRFRGDILTSYYFSALTWQAPVLFDVFCDTFCLESTCTEKKTQSQEPAGSVGSVTLKVTNFLSR